jgi:hypothetical protein
MLMLTFDPFWMSKTRSKWWRFGGDGFVSGTVWRMWLKIEGTTIDGAGCLWLERESVLVDACELKVKLLDDGGCKVNVGFILDGLI